MKNILVVEDMGFNKDLVVQLLEDTYEVLTAVGRGTRAPRPDSHGPVTVRQRQLGSHLTWVSLRTMRARLASRAWQRAPGF